MTAYEMFLKNLIYFLNISKFKIIIVFFILSAFLISIVLNLKDNERISLDIYPLSATHSSISIPKMLKNEFSQDILFDDFIKVFLIEKLRDKSFYIGFESRHGDIHSRDGTLFIEYEKGMLENPEGLIFESINSTNKKLYDLMYEILMTKKAEKNIKINTLKKEKVYIEKEILRQSESHILKLSESIKMARLFKIDESPIINAFKSINDSELDETVFDFNVPQILRDSQDTLFLFGEKYLNNRLNSVQSEFQKNGFIEVDKTSAYLEDIHNIDREIIRIEEDRNNIDVLEKLDYREGNGISYVTYGDFKYIHYPNKNLLIILSLIVSFILSIVTIYSLYLYNKKT